jgi:hypothetical protein
LDQKCEVEMIIKAMYRISISRDINNEVCETRECCASSTYKLIVHEMEADRNQQSQRSYVEHHGQLPSPMQADTDRAILLGFLDRLIR